MEVANFELLIQAFGNEYKANPFATSFIALYMSSKLFGRNNGLLAVAYHGRFVHVLVKFVNHVEVVGHLILLKEVPNVKLLRLGNKKHINASIGLFKLRRRVNYTICLRDREINTVKCNVLYILYVSFLPLPKSKSRSN